MNRQSKIGIAVVIAFAAFLALAAMLQPRPQELFSAGVPVTEDQVRQKLEANGYSSVTIERYGEYLRALAMKDGRQEIIGIDPRNGERADVVVNDVD